MQATRLVVLPAAQAAVAQGDSPPAGEREYPVRAIQGVAPAIRSNHFVEAVAVVRAVAEVVVETVAGTAETDGRFPSREAVSLMVVEVVGEALSVIWVFPMPRAARVDPAEEAEEAIGTIPWRRVLERPTPAEAGVEAPMPAPALSSMPRRRADPAW